jgi:hypothetical protein
MDVPSSNLGGGSKYKNLMDKIHEIFVFGAADQKQSALRRSRAFVFEFFTLKRRTNHSHRTCRSASRNTTRSSIDEALAARHIESEGIPAHHYEIVGI